MTPVPVITGVVKQGHGGNGSPTAVFDWYQASFPGVDADEFIGRFLEEHDLSSLQEYRGKTHGYERGYIITRGEETLAAILFGGNQDAPLNAWASGSGARQFSTWARRSFPSHYLTRGDAALDLNRPGAWLELQDLFFDLRHEFPRVQTSVVGDLFGQQKGVTYYVGSPKSEARARFYQKGLQRPEAAQPDWVRAEVAVRPKGMTRWALAQQPPEMLWSYTPWARRAFESLKGFDPGEAVRETPRRTDLEKRFNALVKQYGKTIAELAVILGTDEELGKALRTGTFPSAEQIGA